MVADAPAVEQPRESILTAIGAQAARAPRPMLWTLLTIGVAAWFLGGLAALLAFLGDPWNL